MRDEPEEPGSGESASAPVFEAPHSNGAVHQAKPRRSHPPWEFLILTLFVLILCIGIVLGWTFVGSHSPEKLDPTSAAAVSAACDQAVAKLKAVPNSYPKLGADRVARVRAENVPLRAMVAQFATIHPKSKTPAVALAGWSSDWSRMIDARARYADDLEASAKTGDQVRLIYPAVHAITPITQNMDDYVRESTPRLNACFTAALQLEVVEGPRDYEKVTS